MPFIIDGFVTGLIELFRLNRLWRGECFLEKRVICREIIICLE